MGQDDIRDGEGRKGESREEGDPGAGDGARDLPTIHLPGEDREPDAALTGEHIAGAGEMWPVGIYTAGRRGVGWIREIRSEDLESRIRDTLCTYRDFPEPGVLFRDVLPLLREPEIYAGIVRHVGRSARRVGARSVAGIESRGFLFGAPAALELGVPFIPIRKRGELPGETMTETYELEHGAEHLSLQVEAIRKGEPVLIVDDVLATGSTLEAAVRLVRRAGGRVAAMWVLVEIVGLEGRERMENGNVLSMIRL